MIPICMNCVVNAVLIPFVLDICASGLVPQGEAHNIQNHHKQHKKINNNNKNTTHILYTYNIIILKNRESIE